MSSRFVSMTVTVSRSQSSGAAWPSAASAWPSKARSTLGRVCMSRVPRPYPIRSGVTPFISSKLSANSARIAAPVGVTSSCGSSHWFTVTPRAPRISSVAVVGTGNRPWAQLTQPVPSTTGAASTRGLPRRSSAMQAPIMSMMESTAPTS